jgi:heterodisulfide reductase subunit B
MRSSKYLFFPGCALFSSGREYRESLLTLSEYFNIELEELKGWTCCAPTAAHGISKLLSIAIPAENLALAEKKGANEIVVPCAMCYSRFKTASHEISADKDTAEKIKDILKYDFSNSVKILHPLEIFSEIKPELIKNDLSKVNAVCYYGCLLTRPPKVKQFDVCENPQSMDNILKALGLNVIDWSYKTDCCGTTFNLTNKDIFLKLTGRILDAAKDAGADVISVACPLCQLNLDSYQLELKKPNIPVLYFTQLIGLAYGIPEKELGTGRFFVEPTAVMEKCAAK